jgi:hypothetical protein
VTAEVRPAEVHLNIIVFSSGVRFIKRYTTLACLMLLVYYIRLEWLLPIGLGWKRKWRKQTKPCWNTISGIIIGSKISTRAIMGSGYSRAGAVEGSGNNMFFAFTVVQ